MIAIKLVDDQSLGRFGARPCNQKRTLHRPFLIVWSLTQTSTWVARNLDNK